MQERAAIVTGASSGIGLGITRKLLEHGYHVLATSRRVSACAELRASPRLVLVDGDVGEARTAERALSEVRANFGRLDLLVNSAGSFMAKPFTDYTSDDYAALLSTNLAGFFHMTQQALRFMVPASAGHIVNIGTSLATQPVAGVPSALPILIKGGIEAATRSLAIEYAARGIRVNTVAAGMIDTPLHAPENHGFLKGLSPANRLGTSEEIAEAVLYLDSARFVSGEILHLDGGAHAGKWS
ncbi:MAG TPA: SDR family oxidoreductase [Polyangiaceae bacterium]|jgi:NAD(P)-dependent dehydrogenase (short-subunit alcohol dehydrogenase family)|nr:SDR family oxidoreductase [Polyangiaceae bacterium]